MEMNMIDDGLENTTIRERLEEIKGQEKKTRPFQATFAAETLEFPNSGMHSQKDAAQMQISIQCTRKMDRLGKVAHPREIV